MRTTIGAAQSVRHGCRLLLLTALCLLTLSCRRESGGAEYRLAYSVFFPASHVQSQLACEWAEEVYQRTGGRVRIDVFPGGTLSGAAENFDCVINRVSDVGMSCFSYTRGLFPLMEALDLPLGYPDGMAATRIANDFLARFQPEELSDVHVLYVHAHGPGLLATIQPVESLDDLKGRSIRGTGITAQMVKAIGANAVGMSQPDTYEALRRGVVDGTFCPMETLKGWRQGEVINYVTKVPAAGYTTAMFAVMNKQVWERFPEDIKATISEVSREWIDRHGKAWDEIDHDGREFVQGLGKTITEMKPEEDARVAAALLPMLESWVKKSDAAGLPGTEAMAFLKAAVAEARRNQAAAAATQTTGDTKQGERP
ncbi:MAG: TRAP transporter substrate-binding protein [Lentisphaeria bacterium]|jgi:TRAP-type C4-dicarboxylate transport system substrate-binding protein